MQTTKIFKTTWLCAGLLAASLMTLRAQTAANWIGPASGGEWNTGANWSTGFPPLDSTTNAFIGVGTNVSYNLPMTAASFGILTNYGILAVNASGFNCSSIQMPLPSVTALFYLTNGSGAVTVSGNFTMLTNGSATMIAGTSLTVGGTLGVETASSSHAAGTCTFTNSGGTLNANGTSVGATSGTGTGKLVISGGVNNLGNTSVGRYATSSASTLGATEGLNIFGGVVTMSNLNASGASYGSAYISGGTVTNFGNVSIGGAANATPGRYMRVVQAGGLFVVPDPGLIYENPVLAGAETARYQVTGGTNIIGGMFLGTSNNATAATVTVTVGGVCYVGSQGIATNGAVAYTFTLNSGGLFGATADWTGSANMSIGSGANPFTFQTADVDGTPHNITLNNPLTGSGGLNKTGGGVLTLDAINTYLGNTLINGGTLALGAGGSLTSPLIIVGSGTTFDVSALGGAYSPVTLQTLSGSGTINGLVTATNGTINPGSNALTGTLTFESGLTEQGGVVNHFDLSSSPSGNNDVISVTGDLTVSGTNIIQAIGTLPNNTNYILIQYTGNFNGDITNFNLVGATGYLTNITAIKAIVLYSQASTRRPTNIVWVGNATANNWDTSTSTNWLNGASLDFFISGDNVRFDNTAGTNTNVNVVGSVSPGLIVMDSTSNYIFGGNGSIDGSGGLTKTNSGTLTIFTTNTYSGVTTVNGGVLEASNIANGGFASAIGSSSSDSGNLVISNGTFRYSGPTASTDRGATLASASSAIDVNTNGNLTVSGALDGNGGLTKIDSGTLILSGGNSYGGSTTLSNGTLQINSAVSALVNTVIFAGGTLSMNVSSQQTYNNPLNIVATSALISAGGNNNVSAGDWTGDTNITLNVGIATNGTFTVNGSLTNFLGTVALTGPGTFRFNSGGGNTSFGAPNSIIDLGTNFGIMQCRNPGTMVVGALAGDATTSVLGQGSGTGTLVWSIGSNTNNPNSTFLGAIKDGTAANRIASLEKVGTGTLTLEGQNTYTGTTTVTSGVLALAFNGTSDGSIGSSTVINIVTGAFLDVSGRSDGTMPLNSTQQLRGRGTINGKLDTTAGGTVAPGGGPGGSTGILTVTNSINLGGTAWMKLIRTNAQNCDKLVSSLSSITYGGTLIVTNAGPPLQVGDTFTLFSGASPSGGTFGTISLPTYYVWDTTQLAASGKITVTAVLPPPAFTSIDTSQLAIDTSITFQATGAPNGPVSLLTSTNLALPISQWTDLFDGNFDGSGQFYLHTDGFDPNAPQQFFLLQAQ